MQWFDAAAPAVADACRAAIGLLEGAGLEVVPLELPELALLRAAHSCTIASEMKNNMDGGPPEGGGGQVVLAVSKATPGSGTGALGCLLCRLLLGGPWREASSISAPACPMLSQRCGGP